VLEAPEQEVDEVTGLVRDCMAQAYDLAAPLKVDLKMGANWLQMAAR